MEKIHEHTKPIIEHALPVQVGLFLQRVPLVITPFWSLGGRDTTECFLEEHFAFKKNTIRVFHVLKKLEDKAHFHRSYTLRWQFNC